MSDLFKFYQDRTAAMLELLEEMVRHESPTRNKPLVDRFGGFMHGILANLDAEIEVFPRKEVGDIRLAKWNAKAPGKPIMMLGHIDTVWPEGTLATDVPIQITDTHFFGPGALDMKSGLLLFIEAIRGLQQRNEFPQRPIWLLLTSDEEVASVHSRELINELAPACGLVLVAEPAGEGEALKTMRKGIGRYWVRSEGLASHSGNAPEAGINAIIDNAHQAIRIHDLNDLPNGTSVSVTTISGGTTINVIPAQAELYVDVRFSVVEEANRVHEAIHSLQPVIPGAKLTVRGWVDRPPLERNERMRATFGQAQRIAEAVGLPPLQESFSGGGSDGNFTAGAGIPTLDGLGPEGTGMHATHEQLLIRSLPRRATLIAGILRDWEMPEE
ncbi:MAG: M20 family metallopeptidase [Chloroflexi bacterium]|nr:M20 family metallopeptidase [Chloroflexota bacterium]